MESNSSDVSDLFDSYRRTTYIAQTPLGEIRLRVGVRDEKLAELLVLHGAQEWAFITAFNPGSQPLSVEENSARQRRLEDTLRHAGWTCFPGEGVGDDTNWSAEQSVLVLGIDRQRAVELAQKFGQNAILAGGGSVPELVDCQIE
jgi:hypothetical protein